MAANAALATSPVAGGQVVKHQGQSVDGQQVGETGLLEIIREQEFDGLEPCRRGRGEAVEERQFGEHHGQVGGEFRH